MNTLRVDIYKEIKCNDDIYIITEQSASITEFGKGNEILSLIWCRSSCISGCINEVEWAKNGTGDMAKHQLKEMIQINHCIKTLWTLTDELHFI